MLLCRYQGTVRRRCPWISFFCAIDMQKLRPDQIQGCCSDAMLAHCRGAGPVGTLAAHCAFARNAKRVILIDNQVSDAQSLTHLSLGRLLMPSGTCLHTES